MNKIKRFFGELLGDKYYCGLDIGTQKIKACLSRVHDAESLDLLAVYESDTKGFKDSSVNDISDFSSAIGTTLDALVKKTQVRFRDVSFSVGGDLIETRVSRAVIPLTERGNKLITDHDVRDVRRQACLLGARLDEEVLCDFVRYFKVDDINIALNPIGLYGRKIEVEVMMVVANVTRLRNISKAIKQAGFEVNNVFFSGQVLVDTLMDKNKRNDGSIMIDIGSKTTQILVFKEGLLKHYAEVDFGGEHITRRIAVLLGISRELAEDIKRSYARVAESVTSSDEEILIKKEQGFVPVKRALLNEAVESEVLGLIKHIQDAVESSGYAGQLKGGILMVGGCVLLPGLMERVERELKIPVSLGRNISGLSNSASFCTASSIAEASYKGTARYFLDTRKPKDWLTSLQGKVEELCNEYF
jgi:cell division protein FtsA